MALNLLERPPVIHTLLDDAPIDNSPEALAEREGTDLWWLASRHGEPINNPDPTLAWS